MGSSLADRIQERLQATGKTARGASIEAGLSDAFVRNILTGKSKSPRSDTVRKLAGVLETTEAWLLHAEGAEDAVGPTGPEVSLSTAPTGPVVVAGKTAAGVFREVDELDQSEPVKVWEPLDEKFPNARRFALDVEGDSMNALKPRSIMNGDRIVCVAFEDIASQVRMRDGLIVVVERTRDGGHTREWSVKQVELYEDRTEFHPRSTDSSFKPIVVKRDAQADEGVVVEVIGLVRAVRNEFPI